MRYNLGIHLQDKKRQQSHLDAIRIPVEHEGIHGDIVIEPYILPPSKVFSSTQAHTKAAGPKKWNQQQGFYIYRNDRMIQSGGWCRIRTIDEHTKLARFAINFTSKIDGAFKIDVSKMYVQLPPQIRKEVEEKTQPLVMQAREIYDNAEKEAPVIIPLTHILILFHPTKSHLFLFQFTKQQRNRPIPNQIISSSA